MPHEKVSDFPDGLSAPAHRALANAGLRSLRDVATQTEKNVAGLHGMGPKGVRFLREALAKSGLNFK